MTIGCGSSSATGMPTFICVGCATTAIRTDRFLLRPGDFVLYDNHRMLHARTAFQGSRWLRGICFNPR